MKSPRRQRVLAKNGKSIHFKLCPATFAMLRYLEAAYAEVFGVDTSGSVIVRRALQGLVADVGHLVSMQRVLPRDASINLEKLAIATAARGYESFPQLPPQSSERPFPTPGELKGFPKGPAEPVLHEQE